MSKENATIPVARAMTRKEIKVFRSAGLDPATSEKHDNNTSTDFVDWILDNVYHGVDFDNVPYYECVKLAGATYKLTYGGPEEIKN